IDSLFAQLEVAASSRIREALNLAPGGYIVLTIHRPVNVDEPRQLESLLRISGEIANRLPVILPAHPRTRESLERSGMVIPAGIRIIEPQPYPDFLRLWSGARLVCTDSGGLQEETSALGIPCLTLRETTERPVTIERGTNRLIGTDRQRLLDAVDEILATPWQPPEVWPPPPTIPLWDGRTAARIIDALLGAHSGLKGDNCELLADEV
ncbi:MAG: UDP-N-acetylglucosamine 2-epimerase, partial [Acidobacteriota bacterium]